MRGDIYALPIETALQLLRIAQAVRMAGAELTARELDVLQQLAKCRSNQASAAALTMSEGTVKFHINHVLHKLGAADRTQAVLTALKRGFAYLE